MLAKIHSQVTHTSYPGLWISGVDNLVDQQGITGGQLVDNWGNDLFPTIHSPYDYDVPITE